MAQAKVISITPDTRDQQHGRAFRDLEGQINDLVHMASLAFGEVEETVQDLVLKRRVWDAEHYQRVLFAVGHLDEMIGALKRDYYAKF